MAQPDFESSDPYSVLGVPKQATFCLIKKTYFKLSRQYHPDHLTSLPNQQDAHTTFTAIANAYEVLKDPEKRREYDILRSLHTDIINDVFHVDVEDSGSEEEKVFSKCDWCQIVDCNFPQLKPLKCTVDGCNNLVHHLCQIEFERREGFPETLPLKCCLHHPQSPLSASKPPPVNDPEDELQSSSALNCKTSMADLSGHQIDAGKKAAAKAHVPPRVDDPQHELHSSSASNSKHSMDDSSGHPIDAGKKAAAKAIVHPHRRSAASSSSDTSSSSDDSSDDDLSNDREDRARSAQTPGRGKDLAFRTRFAQGKQPHLGSPSADESSEDNRNELNEGKQSTTTTSHGKVL